jgi:hypothetical protein
MKTAGVYAVVIVLLGATVAVAVYLWRAVGEASIGLNGWIALGLGGTLTVVLAIVLVRLMHVSARRGYDDGAGFDR